MDIKLNNGLVQEGKIEDFFLQDFGIEFSDKHSFVTLTENPRLATIKQENNKENSLTNSSNSIYDISTAEGNFKLEVCTSFHSISKKVIIKADLTALDEVAIQDFVIRMKFPRETIKHALINNKIISHNDSEKYYQFNTKNVTLVGYKNGSLIITRTKETLCNDAEPHLYVRDLNDFWIVHSRLFPTKNCNLLWLRWINRFFSLSFSEEVSKKIKKIPFIFKFLWYRKERKGKKWIHAQIIGFFKLNKNQKISQTIEIYYE